MSLAETIRAIRKRRGETMASFAARLGVTHPAVSGYESGKIAPSRSMLLLILPLAEGKERPAILQALGLETSDVEGLSSDEVQDALVEFERYLEAGGTGRGERVADKRRFADLARQVLEADEIEPALLGILQKWITHRGNRKARRFFKHLDVYLDVELKPFEVETVLSTSTPRLSRRGK